MPRDVATQKIIGAVLVFLAVWRFAPVPLMFLFSVLGQGHFLGAYYYQWKARKMKVKWVAIYAVLATIFITLALTRTVPYQWFVLVASIIFFLHHFQDEVSLFGKERSLYRGIELLFPFVLYSAVTIDLITGTSLFAIAPYLLVVLGVAYLITWAQGRHTPDMLSVYYFLIALAVYAAYAWLGHRLAPQAVIGSVILFHYICWYVFFYFRFGANPQRQKTYIIDMLVINGIVGVAYLLWQHGNWTFLSLIFGQVFFFIWAIMHILFSVRLSDYRALLKY